MKMDRSQVLDTAKEYVTRDRAATHGSAERSFGLIATYWSAHLDADVTAADVAVMMTMLKLARIKSNPGNMDNWIDGAGYLACGGEIASGEQSTRDHLDAALAHAAAHPFDEGGPYGEGNGPVGGESGAQMHQIQQCREHIRNGATDAWLADNGYPFAAIRAARKAA